MTTASGTTRERDRLTVRRSASTNDHPTIIRTGPRPSETATEEPDSTRLLLGMLAVLAAAWVWRRVYPVGAVPVPALAGTVLGTGALILADRLTRSRRSRFRSVVRVSAGGLAAAAAGLITALTTAEPHPSSPGTALAGTGEAVTGGIARILTTTLPAPPAPDLLPQFAVLCALAGATTAVTARRRGGLQLAVPAGCLLVIGLVCGVGGSGSAAVVCVPFAVVLGLVAIGRSQVLPLVIAGLVAALGCAAGLTLAGTGQEPRDPRHQSAVPLRSGQPTAPMHLLAGWLAAPNETVFTASLGPNWPKPGPFWRIATLDTYDGASWSSSTSPVAIGYDLPIPDDEKSWDATAHVRVTPVALRGVHVPLPGRLTHLVRPAPMAYDLRGDSLVDPDGLHGTYDETVRILRNPGGGLRDVSTGSVRSGDGTLAGSPCPGDLQTQISQVFPKGRPEASYVKAKALQDWFRRGAGFRFDPEAKPGHACGRIQQLLTGKDKHGTPEQFATGYVLMARELGLPTRLAVGFAPGPPDRNGRLTVSSGTATAWPEIRFDGVGWVPFPAVPSRLGTPPHEKEVVAPPPRPDPNPTVRPGPGGQIPEPQPDTTSSDESRQLPVTVLAGGLALVVLLPLAGTAANLRRRRNRKATGPAGAWAEVLDRLSDHGRPSASATPAEIGRELIRLAPASKPDAEALARIIDVHLYAPDRDSGRDSGPDSSWQHLRAIEKALATVVPRRRRLWWQVDPRPRGWT